MVVYVVVDVVCGCCLKLLQTCSCCSCFVGGVVCCRVCIALRVGYVVVYVIDMCVVS